MKRLYRLDRDRLKMVLREQGLKRWWVAEMTCVHKTTLRRWLSGRIRLVEAENVLRLSKVLGVEVERLTSAV